MKVTRSQILNAGMDELNRAGIAGFSVRNVARSLGVRSGALYYYVPSRTTFLSELAGIVANAAMEPGANSNGASSWQDEVADRCERFRQALLAVRDGALLLALAPSLNSPGVLAWMEGLLQTLVATGLHIDMARSAADTLASYIVGFVLQEQQAALAPSDVPPLSLDQFPLIASGLSGASGDDERAGSDEGFRAGIALIVAAIDATSTRDARS
ncbi:MAG: TetR/AcrR family transcriptional regulator [Thermomicrobiales bacterium]